MKASDEYTHDELLLVAAYCGVDLHEDEGLDLEFCEWRHTYISNHSVFLGVSWFGEVSFFFCQWGYRENLYYNDD